MNYNAHWRNMITLIILCDTKIMARALQHEGWNNVMQQEKNYIHKNNTWTL